MAHSIAQTLKITYLVLRTHLTAAMAVVLLSVSAFSFAQFRPPTGLPPGGNLANMQMPAADLEGLFKYLEGLDDKELEELEKASKKMLEQMGFNPDTLKPLEQGPLLPPPPPSKQPSPQFPLKQQPVVKPVPAKPASPQQASVSSVEESITMLLERLSSIRHKASLDATIATNIKAYTDSIDDLLHYLQRIATPDHLKRLTQADAEELRQSIRRLAERMMAHEPSITVKTSMQEDDPYDILGVSSTASETEVKSAFERKKDRLVAKREFITKQLNEREATRELAIIDKSLAHITTAYETLINPQKRTELDTERKKQSPAFPSFAHQRALDATASALSEALFGDRLVNQLIEFLAKHAPQELEARQKQLAAEAAFAQAEQYRARAEAEHLRTTRPVITSSTSPGAYPAYTPPRRTPPGSYPSSMGGTGMPGMPQPSRGGKSNLDKGDSDSGKKSKQHDKAQDKGKNKEKEEDKKDDDHKKDEKKDKKDKKDTIFQPFETADEKMTAFNRRYPDLLVDAESAEQNTAVPDFGRIHGLSNLDDLADSLASLRGKVDEADAFKKMQYAQKWHELDTKASQLNKNLRDYEGRLESSKTTPGMAPNNGQSIDYFQKTAQSALADLGAINAALGKHAVHTSGGLPQSAAAPNHGLYGFPQVPAS